MHLKYHYIRWENKNDENEVIFHQTYAVNKEHESHEDFEYSNKHPCKNVRLCVQPLKLH